VPPSRHRFLEVPLDLLRSIYHSSLVHGSIVRISDKLLVGPLHAEENNFTHEEEEEEEEEVWNTKQKQDNVNGDKVNCFRQLHGRDRRIIADNIEKVYLDNNDKLSCAAVSRSSGIRAMIQDIGRNLHLKSLTMEHLRSFARVINRQRIITRITGLTRRRQSVVIN